MTVEERRVEALREAMLKSKPDFRVGEDETPDDAAKRIADGIKGSIAAGFLAAFTVPDNEERDTMAVGTMKSPTREDDSMTAASAEEKQAIPLPEPTEVKKFGSRELAILPRKPKTEEVFVPEWDAWYIVKGMKGSERDNYELSLMQGKGDDQQVNIRNARAKLIVICTVDQSGAPIFTNADIPSLGAQPSSAIQRLFDVAKKLSGLSSSDLEKLTEGFAKGQSESNTSA